MNAIKMGNKVKECHVSRYSTDIRHDEGQGGGQREVERKIELESWGWVKAGVGVEGESITFDLCTDRHGTVHFCMQVDVPTTTDSTLADCSVTVKWRVLSTNKTENPAPQPLPEPHVHDSGGDEHSKMFFQLVHTEVTRSNRR